MVGCIGWCDVFVGIIGCVVGSVRYVGYVGYVGCVGCIICIRDLICIDMFEGFV